MRQKPYGHSFFLMQEKFFLIQEKALTHTHISVISWQKHTD